MLSYRLANSRYSPIAMALLRRDHLLNRLDQLAQHKVSCWRGAGTTRLDARETGRFFRIDPYQGVGGTRFRHLIPRGPRAGHVGAFCFPNGRWRLVVTQNLAVELRAMRLLQQGIEREARACALPNLLIHDEARGHRREHCHAYGTFVAPSSSIHGRRFGDCGPNRIKSANFATKRLFVTAVTRACGRRDTFNYNEGIAPKVVSWSRAVTNRPVGRVKLQS